jgi:hypothetical protein
MAGSIDRQKDSCNIHELKTWLLQFVSRIDLGYNRAGIFYTYPMIDLIIAGENLNSRNGFSPRGGTRN